MDAACPVCDRPMQPEPGRNQRRAATCSPRCGQLHRFNGCPTCTTTGACDDHQVPPVCVCDQPAPDPIGECQRCLRPYKPQVPGFNECRDAWIAQLAREAA